MKIFEFTIIASGMHPEDEGYEDRFFECGCDDATLSYQKGVIIAAFSREAISFSRAVSSAYEDMLTAGAKIERVEPDHLVSLSEIAERSGLSRQAISLYTRAERAADFPNPVARVTSKHPLWDWYEVANWLLERGRVGVAKVVEAKIIREANIFIESQVSPDDFIRHLDLLEAA